MSGNLGKVENLVICQATSVSVSLTHYSELYVTLKQSHVKGRWLCFLLMALSLTAEQEKLVAFC